MTVLFPSSIHNGSTDVYVRSDFHYNHSTRVVTHSGGTLTLTQDTTSSSTVADTDNTLASNFNIGTNIFGGFPSLLLAFFENGQRVPYTNAPTVQGAPFETDNDPLVNTQLTNAGLVQNTSDNIFMRFPNGTIAAVRMTDISGNRVALRITRFTELDGTVHDGAGATNTFIAAQYPTGTNLSVTTGNGSFPITIFGARTETIITGPNHYLISKLPEIAQGRYFEIKNVSRTI